MNADVNYGGHQLSVIAERFGVAALKMALIDRPYTTYYWSAIVSIALSCTIFELIDIWSLS